MNEITVVAQIRGHTWATFVKFEGIWSVYIPGHML